MRTTLNIVIAAWGLFFIMGGSFVSAQDRDNDGINDILEHKLAMKFAPAWRFNARKDNDNSQQNNNEVAYPSSVEWFHREIKGTTGKYPYLFFRHSDIPGDTSAVEITDMDQLCRMRDPKTGERADSRYWDNKRDYLRIKGYPQGLGGDPQNFPTYYHCSIHQEGGAAGSIVIEYYLWFPDDRTGEYTFLGYEVGNHRGDWENIAVAVSGTTNLGTPDLNGSEGLSRVIYNGHITPGKMVWFGDLTLRMTEGTHPQVFVAWGTHAMYPEPGDWHNWKGACDPIIGICPYDDYFHGNGLVVRSWYPNRELINLGETNQPLVSWLNYNGLWGPDGSASSGSPPSPQYRGEWGTIGNAGDWATIKMAYAAWWEDPINLDGSIISPYGYESEGFPSVVLFKDAHWKGEDLKVSWPSCANIGLIGGEVSSALLLGGYQVRLYSVDNCMGTEFFLTHSCEDFGTHYNHGFNDKAESMYGLIGQSQLYVDKLNNAGYQDGLQSIGQLTGPYSTVGRGLFHASQNATISVTPGDYQEILTIDQKVTIKATTTKGSVIIGRFPD